MNKLRLLGFALLTLGITCGAHADEKRYISDDLITYIHSGPGNQFRIVGTLNSGDEVTLKSVNNTTNYGEVVDAKGRNAWIPLDQLSTSPSLRTQVPNLQQMQQKVTSSDGIINGLKKENQDLKNQLIVAQKKVSAVNVQLDDKQRTIILQWFMYGGGVAGIGLILGLVLPHLVPRRKKKDRWMS